MTNLPALVARLDGETVSKAERLIWNYAIQNIPTDPEREAAKEVCETLRQALSPVRGELRERIVQAIDSALESDRIPFRPASVKNLISVEEIADAIFALLPPERGELVEALQCIERGYSGDPETQVEAMRDKARSALAGLTNTDQRQWRALTSWAQVEIEKVYEVTNGKYHWFAQKEWFDADKDADSGWLWQPCERDGSEATFFDDEPLINDEGGNIISHFRPVDPLPPAPDTQEGG